MTTTQTIINEIRQSRRRMSRECGHDPSKLVAYLEQFNRKYAPQVREYRRTHPTAQTPKHAES